jgi:hypothetical protein
MDTEPSGAENALRFAASSAIYLPAAACFPATRDYIAL